MRKNKFDWLMFFLSFGFSFLATLLCIAFMDGFCDSQTYRLIWSTAFFVLPAVFSLIGVTVAERAADYKYMIRKRGNRAASFIIAVFGAALLGAGGQYAYMQTSHSEHIITENTDIMDAAVIIDYSNSMHDMREKCAEAVCALVDELPEGNRIQFIPMSGRVFLDGATELELVTERHKSDIKSAVESADYIGATDFEGAIETAVKHLKSSGGNSRKAIILLTDGVSDAPIDKSVERMLTESGISLNAVMFDTGAVGENRVSELITATDGREYHPDSGAAAYEITDKLRAVYTSVNESDITVKNRGMLVFGSGDWSRTKLLMRAGLFFLYGILMSAVIYYRISLVSVLCSLIFGIAAAIAADLTGGMGIPGRITASAFFAISFWTAFTIYKPIQGGNRYGG